jgi:hypothetical protein
MFDAVRIEEWEKLDYSDPEPELIRLREIGLSFAPRVTDDNVRAVRTHSVGYDRQRRDAALFCYGIGHALASKVCYSLVERQDYDFVALWRHGFARVFLPVQLKEFVPGSRNLRDSLSADLEGFARYADSRGLVVAINVNSEVRLGLDDVTAAAIPVAHVWLFGAVRPDQSRWMVCGSQHGERAYHEFDFPS